MRPDKKARRLIAVHKGWDAYEAGEPITANPYKRAGTRAAFHYGWIDAKAAQAEQEATQDDDRLRCIDCNAVLDGSNSPEDSDTCFECTAERAAEAAEDRRLDYKTWLEREADHQEDTPALNEDRIPTEATDY